MQLSQRDAKAQPLGMLVRSTGEPWMGINRVWPVSSLGIDRPLKKAADYIRNAGKELEVRLYAPLNGKKQLIGTLESFTDEDFTLLMENDKQITILKKDAALVRPHIRF
jgi:ribosome maturation factor RimP